MLTTFTENLINIFLHIITALLFAWLVFKLSLLLFNVSIAKEIKNGNKAVALFWCGIVIMIGIIIGFLQLQ